jgi:uncharacterized caspase-like protein
MVKNSTLYALIVLLAAMTALPLAAQNRYALVIGNSAYRNLDRLSNPGNDAEDVAAALGRLGYRVTLKRDLGIDALDKAVSDYTALLALNPANEGFFWYAGHGVQIDETGNYLLPVDFPKIEDRPENRSRLVRAAYAVNELLDALDRAQNRANVVVLDACRNNPLPNAGRSGGASRGLSIVANTPPDLIIMYSTAAGAAADDGALGKRNSPFAEAFLKHIAKPDPIQLVMADITGETLFLTGNRQRPYQAGTIVNRNYSLNPNPPPVAAAPPARTPPAQTAAPAPARTPPVQESAAQDFQTTASGNGLEIAKYKGKGGTVVIPASIGGKSVTSIGKEAFSGCSGLTSVTIPGSVTSIGELAFASCSKLTAISVSAGNQRYKDIDGVLFTKDGKTLHTYPMGKTRAAYTIPDSVTSIGVEAFFDCDNLTAVTIPNGVTTIGNLAFRSCSGLTSVTIPTSVTSIGYAAFLDCTGLRSVTIQSGVTSIGSWAFAGCTGLTSVTIPSSVTSISDWAFNGCSGLTSVTIPTSVTSIGKQAFYGCSSLTSQVRADIERRFGKGVF